MGFGYVLGSKCLEASEPHFERHNQFVDPDGSCRRGQHGSIVDLALAGHRYLDNASGERHHRVSKKSLGFELGHARAPVQSSGPSRFVVPSQPESEFVMALNQRAWLVRRGEARVGHQGIEADKSLGFGGAEAGFARWLAAIELRPQNS